MACNESDCEAKHMMETSHTAVEIKIKTLDSQVYTCRVEKNVSVPDLKEQVALVTGVPSGSQRLICRGKVLRDEHALSAYEVEDGHTLHLVTRLAPPSSDQNAFTGVQSEEQEPHDYSPYNRPGHISHSVLVGTFNFPDRGNVMFPEINRLFSSVLSSLRVGSYFPPTLGTGNDNSAPLQPSANVLNGGQEHADPVSTQRVADQVTTGTHQSDADSVDGLLGLRQEGGRLGAMPGVSHVRIVHQIVPNALRTLSEDVERMEQIFAARNEQAQLLPSTSNTSARSQSNAPAHSDDWNPAAWSSLFRRIHELLGNQAASDLLRLANQLEAERSLDTIIARGNLLFGGIILEQLGRLLLNLGGTAMALLMEPSQPGVVSASAAESAPPHQGGETVQYVDNGDVTGNMDIHIHAGLPPFLVSRDLLSQATQDVPLLSLNIDGTRNLANDHSNLASNANLNGHMQTPSLGSMQAPSSLHEHRAGTDRTTELFQDSPFVDNTNGGRGVFYPLLARFRQLNPSFFAQQEQISFNQSGSEEGSSVRRDLDSDQPRCPSLSVLQAVIQNQVGLMVGNGDIGFAAGEQSTPATSLHLAARISESETDAGFSSRAGVEQGYETSSIGNSQHLVRPLLHVLEVSPTAPSDQELPEPEQGQPNQGTLREAHAETSLQLKCTGQTSLDMEWSNLALKDGPSLSDRNYLAAAVRAEDGKINGASKEMEDISEGGLQSFSCRARLGQVSQHCCRTEDVNAAASKGTVLQDFLSTLAYRKEEKCNPKLASTENPQDLSLVLENMEDQGFGLDSLGANAAYDAPFSSPHCSVKQKRMLEIGLDTLGGPSGLESFQRAAMEEDRFCDLRGSSSRDDEEGLQQFFPVARIPNKGFLSPSSHLNALENGEPVGMDTRKLLKLQECSTSAALAEKDTDDLKRHIMDPIFEGLPAVKRQKMP